MKDDNCIFCKLANKDIPTNIIYEDEKFTVILDASPATKGHALILPKNHAANIYELPDEDAADIFVLAKKLAKNDGNEEKLCWNHADLSAEEIAEICKTLDMRN